jgi:riboflavin synthase
MFTGIITGLGRIVEVHSQPGALAPGSNSEAAMDGEADFGKRLVIEAPATYLDDVQLGDSIALNGACMTVTAMDADLRRFSIDISAESLRLTAGLDHPGAVNLEKALRANDRLGGHLVSGHVDGIGTVMRFEAVGESWLLQVRAPKPLARFIATKGSITVNGVSLTVNQLADGAEGCEFSINLIPHTLQNTALGQLGVGRSVNLEIDLIARYVERMLSSGALALPVALPPTLTSAVKLAPESPAST